MVLLKSVNKIISTSEKYIEKHLSSMGVSCHRLILFDSILWFIFIVYYVGHFFYSKQFTKFKEEHKEYESLVNHKDTVIFIVLGLAVILYLHFFVLYKN
tara:strand:+ start:110 stop:406 length:297 start_codon:yes stop_codon:yes gene_type:complete